MRHQQLATESPSWWASNDPVLPVLTCSRRHALERLDRAFSESRPISILVGDAESSIDFLIGRFLAGLGREVTVARLTGPFSDEVSVMRELIQCIGFDSKDLSLTDLENVFTMFLSFQKTHQKRTVLCVEETQDCGSWLIDRISCLAEMEAENQFGLMIIASGRPSLSGLLLESYPAASDAAANQRIVLAPFTLAETREFIKVQVESSGALDVSEMFEFDAITLVHELSEGAADVVSGLYSICLELVKDGCATPLSADMVRKADTLFQSAPVLQEPAVEPNEVMPAEERPEQRHLVVRANGELVKELDLDRGHILIGRDKACDIQLASRSASRHHALIGKSSNGVVVIDLESTNGTFVDGNSVKHYELLESGVMTMGDCRIAYVADEDRNNWYFDISHATHPAPPQPRKPPLSGDPVAASQQNSVSEGSGTSDVV